MIAATACLLAALASTPARAGAPESAEPATPQDQAISPADGAGTELLDESNRMADRVERIRGLRFTGRPTAVRTDAAARREVAARRAAAAMPERAVAARGRAWADLGLGGAETPGRLLAALAADLQGMMLDPEERRILVDPTLLSSDDFAPRESDDSTSSLMLATGVRPDEPALAHVLTHAMQRARSGSDALGGTTDAMLAASAWAEGEANLVAVLFLFEGMGIESQVIGHALDPGQLLGGTLLPPGLDLLPGVEGPLLDFVFREGYAQAASAYLSGGFRAIDRAVTSRRTTRDVLHPDRAPLPAASIPAPTAPKGLLLADRDSVGEQGIIILVSSLTGKDNLGLMAGDGWAGDALFRFEPEAARPTPSALTVWTTRWVSLEEAADFEYGLERTLSARFPGATLVASQAGERVMTAGGKFFRVSREGQEVTLRVSSQPEDKPRVPAAPRKPASKGTQPKVK